MGGRSAHPHREFYVGFRTLELGSARRCRVGRGCARRACREFSARGFSPSHFVRNSACGKKACQTTVDHGGQRQAFIDEPRWVQRATRRLQIGCRCSQSAMGAFIGQIPSGFARVVAQGHVTRRWCGHHVSPAGRRSQRQASAFHLYDTEGAISSLHRAFARPYPACGLVSGSGAAASGVLEHRASTADNFCHRIR